MGGKTSLHFTTSLAAPDAPWLVFGNSLVTDLTVWDAQVSALAAHFNILRYDQRGHGQSEVAGDVDFDLLGRDLLAVIDAAKVGRCCYVGLSMGVPTGLSAFATAPERFTAMVLVDGQARTAPNGAAAWAERIANAETIGMEAYGRQTADRWLTATATPEQRDRLAKMVAATPLDGFRACATALQSYNYAHVLPDLRIPVQLIAGAEDGAMPDSMAKVLGGGIADSRMATIPNAGHVPNFEQPERFNAVLTKFLEEIA